MGIWGHVTRTLHVPRSKCPGRLQSTRSPAPFQVPDQSRLRSRPLRKRPQAASFRLGPESGLLVVSPVPVSRWIFVAGTACLSRVAASLRVAFRSRSAVRGRSSSRRSVTVTVPSRTRSPGHVR